jgi:hypothetical protein
LALYFQKGTLYGPKSLHLATYDFRCENRIPLRGFHKKTCQLCNHLTIVFAIVRKRRFIALQAVKRAKNIQFMACVIVKKVQP